MGSHYRCVIGGIICKIIDRNVETFTTNEMVSLTSNILHY